jgi:hypothetical protein
MPEKVLETKTRFVNLLVVAAGAELLLPPHDANSKLNVMAQNKSAALFKPKAPFRNKST